jgi:hypothetical protein
MPEDMAYRVVYSELVRAKLKVLVERATQSGRGPEALSVLKAIDDALHTNPLAFGDPLYNLPEGTQAIMQRILPPWRMVYGVHREKPIVFVRTVTPYPENAF